ncbi:transposase [Exiguobacterium sp. AB2]
MRGREPVMGANRTIRKSTESETNRTRLEMVTPDERVFADAKEKHDMRWTRYRGLEKVSMQTMLTFAALNLKKMAGRAPSFVWPSTVVEVFLL